MTREGRTSISELFTHSGFFVLRTPLLPAEEILRWSREIERPGSPSETPLPAAREEETTESPKTDRTRLRRRLSAFFERQEILEALFIATPSLTSALDLWRREPNTKKGLQAEYALVRYLLRMAGRSTPFGLFSGCSIGEIADRTTVLELSERDAYRRHCRLDFHFLYELAHRLRREASSLGRLPYFPNSSLYRISEHYKYIETRWSKDHFTHHIVKLDADPLLQRIIDKSSRGSSFDELIREVIDYPDEIPISEEEAVAYIRELIENDILIPEVYPITAGYCALEDLIGQIRTYSLNSKAAEILSSVGETIRTLNAEKLGVPISFYEAMSEDLRILHPEADIAKLFQVDLYKPMKRGTIHPEIVEELLGAVESLWRISPNQENELLARFREEFVERFQEQQIPLVEALDAEYGLGSILDLKSARTDPGHKRQPPASSTGSFNAFHKLLLAKLQKLEGMEIRIEPDEVSQLQGIRPGPLPDAFFVNASLIAPSHAEIQKGNHEMAVHGMAGPSGAKTIGRFCHLDRRLEDAVISHLKAEQGHNPEAIYAEIVHLPEGRLGNVIFRPLLREWEITYLGRSGALQEHQIPISDLLLSVVGRQIILSSRKLGKQVIPRMTNAHNYWQQHLAPIYRFLCMLQNQSCVPSLGFRWGPLESLDFLPRVRIGKVVVSLACWRLKEAEVRKLNETQQEQRYPAIQQLRGERKLPRWVVLADGDNELPLDLENVLCIDSFVHLIKRRKGVLLHEMYPDFSNLCVRNGEGSFFHELVVPFVRKEEARSGGAPPRRVVNVGKGYRSLAMGTDWLYWKLYAGETLLDGILTGKIADLIRKAMEEKWIDRWFFIRYADPERHLRLRFHGDPSALMEKLVPFLAEEVRGLLEKGQIWKVQTDAYEREIERYGGEEGILIAEELFHADSEAVLAILASLEGDEGETVRRQAALLGSDHLLSDFGFSLEDKFKFVQSQRDLLLKSQPDEKNMTFALGDQFRKERPIFGNLLDDSSQTKNNPAMILDNLRRRSSYVGMHRFKDRFERLAQESRLTRTLEDILASFIHMHINRLMATSALNQEMTTYDYLYRLYNGKLARLRSKT